MNKIDVAIIGGGTAGLALGCELKRQGIKSVVVLEREKTAGGVPRHCGHYPFGLREYGRLLKGPEYAKKNVDEAIKLGVDIRVNTTVMALHEGGRLSLTTPIGLEALNAERVVLCTGVRESSRPQRMIGGDRPLGVMTTGALQSFVYLNGMRPFSKPIILGSELVSFSAIDTCRHLGIDVQAMVEEQEEVITHRILKPYLTFRGVPLYKGISNPKIIGAKKVEALDFIDSAGRSERIETDGIIISGHFRPEAALLRDSHLEVDQGTGGPVIDQFGQCSDPAYYCAGNLLRAAESSGYCWREGVTTAKRIAQDLLGKAYEIRGAVRMKISDHSTASLIKFALPQRLTLTDRPGGMQKMQLGLNAPARGTISATYNGESIWRARINSRPVRRIEYPLKSILTSALQSDVELKILTRS